MQPSHAPVKPGQVLDAKYRVEGVLGVGGMGMVVAATELGSERRVALKFLLPFLALDGEKAARFLREARAASQLSSEHVVRVHDVGRLESGSPYMVMERLEGRDLGAILERSGRLPVATAVDYVLQAIDAIDEAHRLGIIHRDLKPSNLFVAQRGTREIVKVLDFGISKEAARHAIHELTRTKAALGTPLYMAPEQMRSTRSVDARADVWALGVVLFELLTGQPPFLGESATELVVMITQDPTPSMHALRADIPAALVAVVERCLAKDPNHRFNSVADLATALRGIAIMPAARQSAATLDGAAVPPLAELRESTPSFNAGPSPHLPTIHAPPAPFAPRSGPGPIVVGLLGAALVSVALVVGIFIMIARQTADVERRRAEAAASASAAFAALDRPPTSPSTVPPPAPPPPLTPPRSTASARPASKRPDGMLDPFDTPRPPRPRAKD